MHTTVAESRLAITRPEKIIVNPSFISETHQNVTTVPGKDNEMLVNLTVSSTSGGSSSIHFKLFKEPELANCTREASPSGCTVDASVTNQTIRVPINASTTYYFRFDNTQSNSSKTVLFSLSLLTSSMSNYATRDGDLNLFGLGLSVLGVVVVAYGVAARTDIPWE